MSLKRFADLAIHRKLIVLLMLTSGAALLLAATMSIVYAYFQARGEAAVGLAARGTMVLGNTRPSIDFEDRTDATAVLATLGSSSEVRLACLYRASGELFAEYRPDENARCPASPPPVGRTFTATRLTVVQRDTEAERPNWLLLQSDLRIVLARLRNQALVTALVFGVALLGAFLLSSALQRIVSRPVAELAGVARAVSATGDYSHRAQKQTNDELGVLADSINGMLERITRVEAERENALVREREANRAKDVFLATLSHELRTPLSAILGWTQLLRRNLVPPEDAARALERIERNAKAQSRLIDDLLDISRILAGKLTLQRQAVNLVPITRTIVEGMIPLAQTRRVDLHLAAGEREMPAFVDADRIGQILSNLLSNALKFTPEGGKVRVGLQRRGDMQELTVTDTGAGISPEFLGRVFEPFRQADSSHTRAHGGLGLGLAIVKRLTEMHGGEVTVDSAGVGQGSTFTVRLPAAAAPAQITSSASSEAATANLSGVRILVVDDDADTRELVERTLTRAGATMAAASSAAEGLIQAADTHPHVLITDIAMPQQDGYVMVERLRGMLGSDSPEVVIALTAFAAQPDIERSMASGFDVHLAKPFDPDLLVVTLNERLQAKRRAAPDQR